MNLTFKNEIPFLEEKSLVELTDSIQTPFYLYSKQSISDTYLQLKKTLKKNIYFAIKANSNQAIISLLNSLGAGADVISIEEMHRALIAGVKPDKIIFEGVGKSQSDIIEAIKNNIKQINVESLEELHQIDAIAQSLNTSPSIGLRINPDIDGVTLEKISTGRKSDKFGIDFNQIQQVCEILKNLKNIELKGLSCHIGSQIFDINIFKKTFVKMKEAIEILKINSFKIDQLNLGGGFGIHWDNQKTNLDINKLASLVDEMFPNPEFNISFEPGRYLVANAGFLITKILTTKINGGINFLITDAGMHTLLRPALYNAYHKIIPFNQKGENTLYTVAGPICESTDILAKNIKLPSQDKNNFLIICGVGAYGSVMASHYNSKLFPAEVMVNNNQHSIIRLQETIQDIVEKDLLPQWS